MEPSGPDRAFDAEAGSVGRLRLPYVLIDHDALVKGGDPDRAVRRVPMRPKPVLAVDRGWMVTPAQYGGLYDALVARDIRLINDPEQYRHAHHLPENYPIIRGRSPRSVWLRGDLGIERIPEALAPFGAAP